MGKYYTVLFRYCFQINMYIYIYIHSLSLSAYIYTYAERERLNEVLILIIIYFYRIFNKQSDTLYVKYKLKIKNIYLYVTTRLNQIFLTIKTQIAY